MHTRHTNVYGADGEGEVGWMGVRVGDNIVQVVRKPYQHLVRYSVFHLSSRKISRHGEKL